jgi:hypothetical protein
LGVLSSDQCRTHDELEEKAFRLCVEVFGDEPLDRTCEVRCWNLSREFSAKLDRVYRCDGECLIVDFKTLWGEVAESSTNLQLRAQAVCAAAELKCHTVYVAIVQVGHKPILCKYELPDLTRAELEILSIINEAEKDNAPRVPSEKACKYCKARNQCPERLHSLESVTPMLPVVQAKGLPAIAGDELARYLDKLPAIERICDDLRAEAKRRIQAGEEIPGWQLTQGRSRETITALPLVHARAAELGVTTDCFTSACSLTKKAAKEMIHAATGSKGKKLEDELAALISGCVTENEPSEARLERVKA